jgi:hypothetical protein
MKTYILAAVLVAVPLAAHADDMLDGLTHLTLQIEAARGKTDCLRPVAQMTMLDQRTCARMMRGADREMRAVAPIVRELGRETR